MTAAVPATLITWALGASDEDYIKYDDRDSADSVRLLGEKARESVVRQIKFKKKTKETGVYCLNTMMILYIFSIHFYIYIILYILLWFS